MSGEIIELRITEADVRAHAEPRLAQELSSSTQTPKLGSTADDTKDRLMNILPQIIVAKISKIVPNGFLISEISLAIKVKGNFAVLGMMAM